MASSTLPAVVDSPSIGNLFTGHVSFQYTEDNIPNPEVLLPSLRRSGYTIETAIGDLTDNPLDAEADLIVITLEKRGDDWTFSVADNGTGMNRDTLDQMLRLGSRAGHDLSSDLGAFGLGSTTASLSLGRQQHVITRSDDGVCLSGATDLDETVRARKFVKHLAEAQDAEVALFHQAFDSYGLPTPVTGTVVRVTKCDNIGRSQLKSAVESVKKFIGQSYRYFINAGKRFYVNGELVEAIDPLERDNPETIVLFDDIFEYVYSKGHTRADEAENIGVILVQLPNWGGQEANRRHGYTIERSGFYVMRNRREIVPHTALSLYTHHNEYARFRGELLFPASMDQDLGVSFMKSVWELKPSQSLKDKLDQVISPYRRQARRFYNTSLSNSADEVPHTEAAKVIKQRAPFLRKPDTQIKKRLPRTKGGERNDGSSTDSKRIRPLHEIETHNALAEAASFEVKDLGPTGPIFDTTLIGQKVIVTYNGQHPFYQRFLLENRDNRAIVTAIDYLAYSMATSELNAKDDDTYKFIERMRDDMSFNLRQLLST